LSTFLLDEESIDHEVFHVQTNDIKRKFEFYFVYPRPKQINSSYSIRFEAFGMPVNQSIILEAVWQYQIQPFVFLPAYRLAKVLRFKESSILDICKKNNSCHHSSTCYPLMNDEKKYYCDCKTGTYGKNCELSNFICTIFSNYCSPDALCRPSSMKPYCICPFGRIGPRCYLYTSKKQNSSNCFNGGTRSVFFNRSSICLCKESYYGDLCQYRNNTINVELYFNTTQISSNPTYMTHLAATLQLYDYNPSSLQLILKKQILCNALPTVTKILNHEKSTPLLSVVKLYYKREELLDNKYFLLYIQRNQPSINLTVNLTFDTHCEKVSVLLMYNRSIIEQAFHNGKFY
jgi:hypothetical protein